MNDEVNNKLKSMYLKADSLPDSAIDTNEVMRKIRGLSETPIHESRRTSFIPSQLIPVIGLTVLFLALQIQIVRTWNKEILHLQYSIESQIISYPQF